MVIELDPGGLSLSLNTCGLSLQSFTASCRWLGVMMGHKDAVDETETNPYVLCGAGLHLPGRTRNN